MDEKPILHAFMKRRLLKPVRLRPGDLIGLISPSGPVVDLARVERGVRYLERRGYRVRMGRHALKVHGFLAGTDEERLADLHEMFEDREVKAIICLRGGYGLTRLLPRLNYELVASHPKIVVGFSDITALQLALWRHCRMVTFHGPMVQADFSGVTDEVTEESLWRLLTIPDPPTPYVLPEAHWGPVRGGHVTGRLIGGNLSLLTSLVGTPYQPSFRKALLFVEEVAEEPYRIDRMFTQLIHAGVPKKIAGLLTGQFSHCIARVAGRPSFTLDEVLGGQEKEWGVPWVSNLPFGHVRRKITLPIGVRARLDFDQRELRFLEAAVI
ncbi:MAG TPA: LD-carboxypeptidase, partial [Candidatus Paceibacterota bacterium]|nr:LD-carboxypeptidase [Candidatus Paceibacterota bacterium]